LLWHFDFLGRLVAATQFASPFIPHPKKMCRVDSVPLDQLLKTFYDRLFGQLHLYSLKYIYSI
jgi:hypothetical protein